MSVLAPAPRPRLGPKDRIFFQTPGRFAAMWPYMVAVAGETHYPKGASAVTHRYHAHTLVFTLAGRGMVEVAGQSLVACPGQVLWLDTAVRYAHYCHPDEKTWSYLWFSVAGHGLDAVYAHLQAASLPLFEGAVLGHEFERILAFMAEGRFGAEAGVSAAVSEILALLLQDRKAQVQGSAVAGRVQAVMDRMRAQIAHPWHIEELAEIAQLSPSQLFRQFRRHTATTPLDWLRHERMSLAKRFLSESEEQINQIALRCGYEDPYHFSRDFRKIVGQSPTQFRSITFALAD